MRLIITLCLILIASTAFAAPKFCLVWEQQVQSVGSAVPAETTRSRIFDTVAEAVAFLEKRKIPDTAVTGLWELRPAAKQVITATTVEVIEPEIIKERRHTEIKWTAK